MREKYLPIIIILMILFDCASQKAVIDDKRVKIEVPTGIDTLTTMIADSIFSRISIIEEDQRRAKQLFEQAQSIWGLGDSLWLTAERGILNHEDSIRVLQQTMRAQRYLQVDPKNFKQIKKLQKKLGNLNTQVVSAISTTLMLQAVTHFENAIQENRFEIDFRLKLIQSLQSLSERMRDKSYLIRTAEEFEKIISVKKDNHTYFYQLGKKYFDLRDWKKAFKNFELAKKTIRTTAIFYIQEPEQYFTRPNETPLDTARLVNYLYNQALCKTKLYEDRPALSLFREALQITPSIENKEMFQRWIDWILWDDGNIRASEMRDAADSLRRDRNYLVAKNGYLVLLPILWTKRTQDQINWHIAVIDYSHLNNKAEGLDRLYLVIKNSATDSITGAPLDSAYQTYFDDYGTMCYNWGAEYLAADLSNAYIYFSQAAETNYKQRAKAILQLASLSTFDPKETIQLCKQANNYLEILNSNEKKLLFELFYRSYRKLGDFTASKQWFNRWKGL